MSLCLLFVVCLLLLLFVVCCLLFAVCRLLFAVSHCFYTKPCSLLKAVFILMITTIVIVVVVVLVVLMCVCFQTRACHSCHWYGQSDNDNTGVQTCMITVFNLIRLLSTLNQHQ